MRLLEILAKASPPNLGLVRLDGSRIGVHGALLDALADDAELALQARRLGYRQPLPGVVDSPPSRTTLDAVAEDDEATAQAAALLDGEVDGMAFLHPVLPRLLRHAPELPLPSVAALEAPDDLARRPFVKEWLEHLVASGRLPKGKARGHVQIDRRDYATIADRPAPSMLVDAWLRHSTAHFTR